MARPGAGARPGASAGPAVVGRPPRILAGFLALGVALHIAFPMSVLPAPVRYWPGGALILAGLGLFFWACATMQRAGTNIPTCKPALKIVVHGPFRLSRNPIYLSMALFFLGVATAVGGLWLYALFPPWFALMEWGVIRREERYLAARFGNLYDDYRRALRRWI